MISAGLSKSRASITFVSVYGITRMMPMATAMAEETMMWQKQRSLQMHAAMPD